MKRPNIVRAILAPLSVMVLAMALSGCGFKLRGSDFIAPDLKRMYLDTQDKYSELANIVKLQLQLNDIQLIDQASDDAALLELYKDKLDRRTLSIFPNGQVAEYELIYSVKYAIAKPGEAAKPFEFEIYRDYQDDPQSALAKSKELKLILAEMRRQAADKIIRQLASFNGQN